MERRRGTPPRDLSEDWPTVDGMQEADRIAGELRKLHDAGMINIKDERALRCIATAMKLFTAKADARP